MGGGFSTKQPEQKAPTSHHSAGPPSAVVSSSGKNQNRRSSVQSALVAVGIIKETSQGGSSTPTNSMASGGRRGSHQHVQEEAASFRSKSSSIKMMMRNSAYRKSFFSFLENQHSGKEELMDYFLLIETIKKVKDKDEKRKKFTESIERYEKKATGGLADAPETIIFGSMHHWKGVPNLTDEELAKHIERSQDDILLSLTPLFEAFLESPYFQEVKEQESREEKRRFSTQSLGPEMRPKEKFVNS